MKDIPVFPDEPQMQHLVYDQAQREYYNRQTDIYFSEDDISYHKLRPYSSIPQVLPFPLPNNYFSISSEHPLSLSEDKREYPLSLSEVEGESLDTRIDALKELYGKTLECNKFQELRDPPTRKKPK